MELVASHLLKEILIDLILDLIFHSESLLSVIQTFLRGDFGNFVVVGAHEFRGCGQLLLRFLLGLGSLLLRTWLFSLPWFDDHGLGLFLLAMVHCVHEFVVNALDFVVALLELDSTAHETILLRSWHGDFLLGCRFVLNLLHGVQL